MQTLESRGLLDRAVEYLPDDMEIGERRKRGQGLTRPELAVLLAYAKLTLYGDLLELAACRTIPYLGRELKRYFPSQLVERYPDALDQHRLRREIIATQLTNSMINRGGPSFAVRIGDQTGAPAAAIAAAFFVVRNSYDMIALNTRDRCARQQDLRASSSSNSTPRSRTCCSTASCGSCAMSTSRRGSRGVVEHYRAGIETVAAALDDVLPPDARKRARGAHRGTVRGRRA